MTPFPRRSKEVDVACTYSAIECIDSNVATINGAWAWTSCDACLHVLARAFQRLGQRRNHGLQGCMRLKEAIPNWLASQVAQCMHDQLLGQAVFERLRVRSVHNVTANDFVMTFQCMYTRA